MRRLFPVILIFSLVSIRAGAQDRGDEAAAERYSEWALDAMGRGHWPEALEALERAGDYGDVSSDISLLLALARDREGRPAGAVLEAVRRALEVNRWKKRAADEARLLEAETLIRLRRYGEALGVLDRAGESEKKTVLTLLALKRLPDLSLFRGEMKRALDRYPRDPAIARILLEYAAGRAPQADEEELVSLVLRRLPVLLEGDPGLVSAASSFIRDEEEVRRLAASYRAVFPYPALPPPETLPAALNAGLVDDAAAADELLGPGSEKTLDRDLVVTTFSLLRSAGGRDRFNGNLLTFSGVLMEDSDKDGFYETRTRYLNGEIQHYLHDADQDGLADLFIVFSGGEPARAEQTVLPESARVFSLPMRDEETIKVSLVWEQYPAVLRADLEGAAYIPRPFDFFFSPVRFVELCETGGKGLLYPELEKDYARLSRRALVSFSVQIRRPGSEFSGAVEHIELEDGIPLRSVEMLDGRVVSQTEFLQGRPVTERIDLDLDGRMETVRRFRPMVPPSAEGGDILQWKKEIEFSESDWDGDGRFETAEEYPPGGGVRYYKDMDGDGLRDYVEYRAD
jgi:tetratricopeptide (TPR) repeat protein